MHPNREMKNKHLIKFYFEHMQLFSDYALFTKIPASFIHILINILLSMLKIYIFSATTCIIHFHRECIF